jgi:tricorn protease-like protein
MAKVKENPKAYEGKQYIVKNGAVITFDGEKIKSIKIKHGEFGDAKNSYIKVYVSESTEVEEMQKPITVVEAMRLYREGKTVICTWGGLSRIYTAKIGNMLKQYNLNDNNGMAVSALEILEGVWTVAD